MYKRRKSNNDFVRFILQLICFLGDYEKVKQLDKLVTQEANFQESYPITGQTYPRLVDVTVVSALAIFGAALHKVFYGT